MNEERENPAGCEPAVVYGELIVTRDENGVHLSLKAIEDFDPLQGETVGRIGK